MKITMNNMPASVCDGCSNWRICKFSEDVKRAEAEYKQLWKGANWPECVETTLGCKYKQYVSNGLNYNDFNITEINTDPSPFRYHEGLTCNTVE